MVLGEAEGTRQREARCGNKGAAKQVSRRMSAPSFAGVGQRRRSRGLDILTMKWAIGDVQEECRILLNTHLMFLKKEKDPTSKQLDDDEWIRSLTEAQEITVDVPEDTVVYDQQAVDTPKKSGPFKWANSCGNTSRGGSSRSVRVKSQLSRQPCGSSELDPKAVLRLSPSFISGPQDHRPNRLPESKSTNKTASE